MSETMKAAIFDGEGILSVKEVPMPRMKLFEDVLIKVEMASVCGTDCHILSVPPGHPATAGVVLGHEYMGEVVETGKWVSHLKPGDRVIIDPNITCGLCRYCRMGLPNMCENMTTLGIFIDGGFAPYNIAPAKACHPISEELPAEKAIFAEPLSCVINGTNKLALRPGETVVILGAGPIGLLYTAMMKLSGAGRIIVAEVSSFRAEKAREMGADIVVNPKEQDLAEEVRKVTGIGADAVVDAVGSLIKDAVAVCRRGGRVLLFGMNSNARCDFTQFDITRHEISVLGTYIAKNTFPPTIQLIENTDIPLEKLVTHRITLDELPQGIETMRSGEAIEMIVIPK